MAPSAEDAPSKRPRTSNCDAARDPFHRPVDGLAIPYLDQRGLKYEAGKTLVDVHGFAVMMEWERGLMAAHAAYVCGTDDSDGSPAPSHPRVLNVGHGMGIVDEEIQARIGEGHHIIVEAHPEVFPRAKEWAAGCKHPERVRVVGPTRWQEVDWEAIGPFTGIFWDTYEETVEDFFPLLPRILAPGGRFSFYNVYQPHDAVRHVAYSSYLQAILLKQGYRCTYHHLPVHVPPEDWEGIESPYWLHQMYLVPKCVKDKEECNNPEQREEEEAVAKFARALLPEERTAAGLESGQPLHTLLWKAKLWEVTKIAQMLPDSSAAAKVAAPSPGEGEGVRSLQPEGGPLTVLWDECVKQGVL